MKLYDAKDSQGGVESMPRPCGIPLPPQRGLHDPSPRWPSTIPKDGRTAVGGHVVLRNVEGSQGIVAQEGMGQGSPTPKDRQAVPN